MCFINEYMFTLFLKQPYNVETSTPNFIDKIINVYKVLVSYSRYPSSL